MRHCNWNALDGETTIIRLCRSSGVSREVNGKSNFEYFKPSLDGEMGLF